MDYGLKSIRIKELKCIIIDWISIKLFHIPMRKHGNEIYNGNSYTNPGLKARHDKRTPKK